MTKHNPEHKRSAHELTDENLSGLTGGMFDAYLQIDGIRVKRRKINTRIG